VANFQSVKQLRRHARRHATECRAVDENEYVARASALCDGPCPPDTVECERNCPDDTDAKRIRFRDATGEYVIVLRDQPAVLVTYYILHPIGTVGVLRTHQFATNREFFDADCECRA
jgi:hypothetical protein